MFEYRLMLCPAGMFCGRVSNPLLWRFSFLQNAVKTPDERPCFDRLLLPKTTSFKNRYFFNFFNRFGFCVYVCDLFETWQSVKYISLLKCGVFCVTLEDFYRLITCRLWLWYHSHCFVTLWQLTDYSATRSFDDWQTISPSIHLSQLLAIWKPEIWSEDSLLCLLKFETKVYEYDMKNAQTESTYWICYSFRCI